MLGHDPAAPLKQPIDVAQLKDFYQKWYTPDAMTLIVVGNVDSRSVAEQINKTFGDLKGKRETPAAVPTLSPLPTVPVSIMTNAVRQDKLSIMWDAPWQPIRDSAALQRYWRDDLAREALFWHVQQSLSKNNVKDIGLGLPGAISARAVRHQHRFTGRAPEQQPERGFARAGESAGQRPAAGGV